VLTGVVDDGTARAAVRDNPLRDGRQVAGKTGTSDDNKSAWFTGFTPGLVTSVGLFGEDDKPPHKQVEMYGAGGEPRVNGGGYPARIWAAYTFGVRSGSSRFDLDTDQGAAVEPAWTPSATPSRTPSQTPSQEPTTEEPTSEPPSRTPSQTPSSEPPSQTPTSKPPVNTPSAPPTFGIPEQPGDPDEDQDE
jgi:membrane peptidoglycan carboxypeptidase